MRKEVEDAFYHSVSERVNVHQAHTEGFLLRAQDTALPQTPRAAGAVTDVQMCGHMLTYPVKIKGVIVNVVEICAKWLMKNAYFI